ncbi:hypothetical protein [Pseudobacillus wudalianchiensis]|uniref:Uncharacterized protein n=1 Tax=Pseudobacillus wudalianchiensis TaxID=1743143 RepID=A0A1B9ATU1_9BACI|nr:hypothetical protein [Bacillus wudalianchiensis]OCA87283.1 hypothetical protein A8F95_08525 [Bacillus wudalianchiensis]
MPNFFTVLLDTTGPSNPSILLNSNAQYSTSALVTATINTNDADKTGYQMKIWGDIDLAWAKANGLVGAAATAVDVASALWIGFKASQQLQLSNGDGNKTINLQLRDDVYNVSAQVSDSITLDTTRPIVTITGPDVPKISKQAGKDTVSFSFTVDSDFKAYKVMYVASSGAAHDTGTNVQIGIVNGSENMQGTGIFASGTVINCSVKGADLEAAKSGDGNKTIKVFVQDDAGNWSI